MDLEGQPVMIWDAESLVVFKMMFFREEDMSDRARRAFRGRVDSTPRACE